MNTMWAPWRMEYIRQPKTEGCFLCQYAADPPEKDRENLLLHRGSACVVVMNRYPYNNGHLMIAPVRHICGVDGMNREERLETMDLLDLFLARLKKVMSPDGFNVGINLGKVAGAGLDSHIHLHIVPRWNGDTNFMPVFADVKVIPQSLEELYDILKA